MHGFRYKEIRTTLGTDDYVRIGGYIATLDSLGIQFITVLVTSIALHFLL